MKVVMIMGYGRSGSTVLDTILGSASGVVGVGELTNLPGSGWLGKEHCACGRRGDECEFWLLVKARWMEKSGSNPEELYFAQRSLEARRHVCRAVVGMPGRIVSDYARYLRTLYQAIAEYSGASAIVDSSKNPQRAMSLSRIPEIDLRLVHLVRDVRGVAFSLKRSFHADLEAGVQKEIPSKAPLMTALAWSFVNMESEWAMHLVAPEKRTRIRYEDLVENPAIELGRVARMAEIKLDRVIGDLLAGRPMKVGHTIAGNRLRMEGAVTLRPDLAWRSSMSRSMQAGLGLAVAPLMLRYGYKV